MKIMNNDHKSNGSGTNNGNNDNNNSNNNDNIVYMTMIAVTKNS